MPGQKERCNLRQGKATKGAAVLAWVGAVLLLGAGVGAATPAKKGTAGGFTWDVPTRWTEQPARSMRVATYTVPAATAALAGECAVFFFGSGEGGSVDANVERWSRQFEGTPKPERSARTVRGIAVTTVKLTGSYLAPGGPTMQSQGKRPGYVLVGAIAEMPEGNLFFKLTGPEATVLAARAEWEALLASLAPAVPTPLPRTPTK
jgi:hypothetical protein